MRGNEDLRDEDEVVAHLVERREPSSNCDGPSRRPRQPAQQAPTEDKANYHEIQPLLMSEEHLSQSAITPLPTTASYNHLYRPFRGPRSKAPQPPTTKPSPHAFGFLLPTPPTSSPQGLRMWVDVSRNSRSFTHAPLLSSSSCSPIRKTDLRIGRLSSSSTSATTSISTAAPTPSRPSCIRCLRINHPCIIPPNAPICDDPGQKRARRGGVCAECRRNRVKCEWLSGTAERKPLKEMKKSQSCKRCMDKAVKCFLDEAGGRMRCERCRGSHQKCEWGKGRRGDPAKGDEEEEMQDDMERRLDEDEDISGMAMDEPVVAHAPRAGAAAEVIRSALERTPNTKDVDEPNKSQSCKRCTTKSVKCFLDEARGRTRCERCRNSHLRCEWGKEQKDFPAKGGDEIQDGIERRLDEVHTSAIVVVPGKDEEHDDDGRHHPPTPPIIKLELPERPADSTKDKQKQDYHSSASSVSSTTLTKQHLSIPLPPHTPSHPPRPQTSSRSRSSCNKCLARNIKCIIPIDGFPGRVKVKGSGTGRACVGCWEGHTRCEWAVVTGVGSASAAEGVVGEAGKGKRSVALETEGEAEVGDRDQARHGNEGQDEDVAEGEGEQAMDLDPDADPSDSDEDSNDDNDNTLPSPTPDLKTEEPEDDILHDGEGLKQRPCQRCVEKHVECVEGTVDGIRTCEACWDDGVLCGNDSDDGEEDDVSAGDGDELEDEGLSRRSGRRVMQVTPVPLSLAEKETDKRKRKRKESSASSTADAEAGAGHPRKRYRLEAADPSSTSSSSSSSSSSTHPIQRSTSATTTTTTRRNSEPTSFEQRQLDLLERMARAMERTADATERMGDAVERAVEAFNWEGGQGAVSGRSSDLDNGRRARGRSK